MLGNRGGRRGAQGSHVARKRKLKKMTKAGARESFYLMAANVCGIHMEKGGETMGVIEDVTTAGERDTGYDASEKLDELIRLMHEGNARLAVWADTHLTEEEMGHMVQYLHAHADLEAYGSPGETDPLTGHVHAGVMLVWDPSTMEVDRDSCREVLAA